MEDESKIINSPISKRGRSLKKRLSYKEPEKRFVHNKWSESEIAVLVDSIRKNGMMNIPDIAKDIPSRDPVDIKRFIYFASVRARMNYKESPIEESFTKWIRTCVLERDSQTDPNSLKLKDVGIALHLLSIDGVIDNHPLVREEGVDFAACYRFLHQCVLGHPVQPVNSSTLNLLYEIFNELSELVSANPRIVELVHTHLKSEFNILNANYVEKDVVKMFNTKTENKSVRMYEKKKKVVCQPPTSNLVASGSQSTSGDTVNIDCVGPWPATTIDLINSDGEVVASGTKSLSTTLSSPCLSDSNQMPTNFDKEALQKIVSDPVFNPLKLPDNWLYNVDFLIEGEKVLKTRKSDKRK